MTAESDLVALYSTRILALAADMPLCGRLDAPDGTGTRRSPLCGSTITVDINVNDGVISDYRQDVRACALGQAAASVVGRVIVGRSRDEVALARDALALMLAEDGPAPAAPFDELGVLTVAREHRNRHASILLALEATLAAFDDAESRQAG